ncbi:MAG: HAMP domain-containing histidine kinase [Elusimicrobia bacterium]|nr:HAMP domain-containing histidine kinase [Elusimicrobiota bacterium]
MLGTVGKHNDIILTRQPTASLRSAKALRLDVSTSANLWKDWKWAIQRLVWLGVVAWLIVAGVLILTPSLAILSQQQVEMRWMGDYQPSATSTTIMKGSQQVVKVYATVRTRESIPEDRLLVRFRYGTPSSGFCHITNPAQVKVVNVWDKNGGEVLQTTGSREGTSFRIQGIIPLDVQLESIDFRLEVADRLAFNKPGMSPQQEEGLWQDIGTEQLQEKAFNVRGHVLLAKSPEESARLKLIQQILDLLKSPLVTVGGFISSLLQTNRPSLLNFSIQKPLGSALQEIMAAEGVLHQFGKSALQAPLSPRVIHEIQVVLRDRVQWALRRARQAKARYEEAFPGTVQPSAIRQTREELGIIEKDLMKVRERLEPRDGVAEGDSAWIAFKSLTGVTTTTRGGFPLIHRLAATCWKMLSDGLGSWIPAVRPSVSWPPTPELTILSTDLMTAPTEQDVAEVVHRIMSSTLGYPAIYIYSLTQDPLTGDPVIKAEFTTGEVFSEYRVPSPPRHEKWWLLEKLKILNQLRQAGQPTPSDWWFFPLRHRGQHLLIHEDDQPTVTDSFSLRQDDRFVSRYKHQIDRAVYGPSWLEENFYLFVAPAPATRTDPIEPLWLIMLHNWGGQGPLFADAQDAETKRRLLQTFVNQIVLAIQRVRTIEQLKKSNDRLWGELELLRSLAHDVGSTVTAASGLVKTLLKDLEPVKEAEPFSSIHEAFQLFSQELDKTQKDTEEFLQNTRDELSLIQDTTQDTLQETSRQTEPLAPSFWSRLFVPWFAHRASAPTLFAELSDRLYRALTREEVQAAVDHVLPRTRDPKVHTSLQAMGRLALETIDLLDAEQQKREKLQALRRSVPKQLETLQQNYQSVLTHLNALSMVLPLDPTDQRFTEQASAVSEVVNKYGRWLHGATEEFLGVIEKLSGVVQGTGAITILPTWKSTDLTVLLEDACNLRQAMAKDHGITLILPSTLPQPWEIITDPWLLRGTLALLIDNAIKYTAIHHKPLKSTQGWVKVAATAVPEEPRVVIEISDNGRGINADEIEKIWLPSWGQGYGLGLFKVRENLKALGGEITLETTPGDGTTFRISLPVTPPKDPVTLPFQAPRPRTAPLVIFPLDLLVSLTSLFPGGLSEVLWVAAGFTMALVGLLAFQSGRENSIRAQASKDRYVVELLLPQPGVSSNSQLGSSIPKLTDQWRQMTVTRQGT